MSVLSRALAWYRPDWPRIVVALGLLCVTTAAAVLKPWPLAVLIDRLGADGEPAVRDLAFWVAALFGVHALHHGLTAGLNALVIHTGLRGLARVRAAVHDALLRLPFRQALARSSGDLIYRATWDTYAFQTLFTQGLFTLAGALLNVAAMAAVMWQFNPRLTGLALLAAPALLVVMRLFGRSLAARALEAQNADAALATRIEQTLPALRVIQSFTAEIGERRRFQTRVRDALATRWTQHRTEVAYLLGVGLVFAAASAGLVWMGAAEVRQDRLTIGQLLVFLAYLGQLHEPLSQITHVGATVTSARAGAGRVLELLDWPGPPDAGRSEPPGEPGHVPGLAFDDVHFAYVAGKPVLKGVRFALRPGETVALVGPSGSGKSTLLNLVARFLVPDSGRVLLDGVPLGELRLRALRGRIAYVPQEPVLLASTVAENVAIGQPGATRAGIEQAARAARAWEFIQRLPEGLDTPVGDGAGRLSVGEGQRISLARAFLKDAPLLLLDEPTSALDAENESAVLQALSDLRRGRTTLMVTHRPATLRAVDRVLVLVDGQVVADGSPDELASRPGWFSDWCRISQG